MFCPFVFCYVFFSACRPRCSWIFADTGTKLSLPCVSKICLLHGMISKPYLTIQEPQNIKSYIERKEMQLSFLSPEIQQEKKKSQENFKGAKSQFAHLEKFSLNVSSSSFVIRTLIFSILNHPCFFMVYYYLVGVFQASFH